MRIYNGKKSALSLPLSSSTRITIEPYSVSRDLLVTTEFLSLLITSYDYSEVAIIVSGAYELNQCAKVPSAAGFVVQTLEEAIDRFTPKTAVVEEIVVPVPTPEPTVEEKVDEIVEEVEKVVEKVKIKTKKAVAAVKKEETKIDEDMATGTPIIEE